MVVVDAAVGAVVAVSDAVIGACSCHQFARYCCR